MDAPAMCPCCGVMVMPAHLSYDFDGETVASLTREVAYLRATVARLRGAPSWQAATTSADLFRERDDASRCAITSAR